MLMLRRLLIHDAEEVAEGLLSVLVVCWGVGG